jgi:hypothetical protein
VKAVLLIEISGDGQEWTRGGTLSPGQPEGSISHNWPDGKRDVILFRCHGDYSVIRLSVAGVDYEDGDDRMIMSAGLREVARLAIMMASRSSPWLSPARLSRTAFGKSLRRSSSPTWTPKPGGSTPHARSRRSWPVPGSAAGEHPGPALRELRARLPP